MVIANIRSDRLFCFYFDFLAGIVAKAAMISGWKQKEINLKDFTNEYCNICKPPLSMRFFSCLFVSQKCTYAVILIGF